jgi:hypothetical protein
MPATACRRAYDHRMRDLVCEERDPALLHHLGVPRSTAASWIRRGPRPVVSAEVLSLDHAELQAEVLALRRPARGKCQSLPPGEVPESSGCGLSAVGEHHRDRARCFQLTARRTLPHPHAGQAARPPSCRASGFVQWVLSDILPCDGAIRKWRFELLPACPNHVARPGYEGDDLRGARLGDLRVRGAISIPVLDSLGLDHTRRSHSQRSGNRAPRSSPLSAVHRPSAIGSPARWNTTSRFASAADGGPVLRRPGRGFACFQLASRALRVAAQHDDIGQPLGQLRADQAGRAGEQGAVSRRYILAHPRFLHAIAAAMRSACLAARDRAAGAPRTSAGGRPG